MRQSFQHFGFPSRGYREVPYLDRGTATHLIDVLFKVPAAPSQADVTAAFHELRRRVRSDRLDVALDTLRGGLRC
jgi:hypothetical protein